MRFKTRQQRLTVDFFVVALCPPFIHRVTSRNLAARFHLFQRRRSLLAERLAEFTPLESGHMPPVARNHASEFRVDGPVSDCQHVLRASIRLALFIGFFCSVFPELPMGRLVTFGSAIAKRPPFGTGIEPAIHRIAGTRRLITRIHPIVLALTIRIDSAHSFRHAHATAFSFITESRSGNAAATTDEALDLLAVLLTLFPEFRWHVESFFYRVHVVEICHHHLVTKKPLLPQLLLMLHAWVWLEM